jgi:transposase InsO family protein
MAPFLSAGVGRSAFETVRHLLAHPGKNAYAERLIGSIRRECIDHIVVFGERHLRHVLLSYMDYYNGKRAHMSLNKDAPISRGVERAGHILCRAAQGGPHHRYVRTGFSTGRATAAS